MKKIGFCLKSNIQRQGKRQISLTPTGVYKINLKKKKEEGDFCIALVTNV